MDFESDDGVSPEVAVLAHNNLESALSSGRSHTTHSPRGGSSEPPTGKVELVFSSVPTLPLLELPKGSTESWNGKYDYSVAVDKPFAIDVPRDEELTNFQVNVETDDFLKAIPEPDTGIFPEEFDIEKFEKVAANICCLPYVPYVFMSTVQPLRPPNEISDTEKCEDVAEITRKKKAADSRITYIKVADTQLSPKTTKSLGKFISQYSGLRVLILRAVKLQKLDDFVLPKLQYVDLSKNLLKTVKSCLAMFKHSPYLEVIKLQDNPVTQKPSYRAKVIGSCSLFLRALDDQRVEIQERIDAMITYGPKQVKNNVGPIQWDLSFVATPEVKAMKAWQPSQLVMLTLPKQNLTFFNVGGLVNLEYLDLSRNAIREIRGMGLEKCHALQHLNLKQNLIAKRESLKVLGFLPCLQYLMLKGNPVTKAPDYRLIVTFETRYLKGSNRTTGLVELDEIPITIDERIAALEANKTSIDIAMWRWKYMIMQSFGHMQIKTPEVISKIRTLSYPKSKLTVVEISGFTSLEYLDLSKNGLKDVAGLECLTKLRFLNLSDNTKLKWKAVLSKLRNVTTLEKANLCVTMEGHPRQADNKKYRACVLKELLLNNPDLFAVDEIAITPAERVETFRSMKGVKTDTAERYRFLLAVNINTTPPTNRKYHPGSVGVGKQYDSAQVTSLLRLQNMGIQIADFSPFANLEEINMSRNRLTDLTTIGLQKLQKLKVLDVSFNQLSGSLKALAAFLDTLKTLECLCIRGNPIVKNFPEDRKRLISLMASMKEVHCRLQVIDIQISISERIEAWRKSAVAKKGHFTMRKSLAPAPEQLERFRMEAIMFQRIPSNVPASQLKTLDLHECALASFDLTKFTALEMLLMRKNDVRTPGDLVGLLELAQLRVLDLRDNCFERLEDFVSIVNDLPALTAIGVRGNRCTATKDYRARFIAQLPQLHERRFRLAVVDNQPVSIDEICSAWKAPKGMSSRDKFFHVLILRKTPDDVPVEQVRELDLALCGLTDIDLIKFTGLEKLSLRGNSLDAANLLGSHVTALQHLTALDVSDNNICDFGALIAVSSALPALTYFACSGNPCFPNNEPLLRINILAKLPSMRRLGAPLKLLNGYEISIDERCSAVERDPNIDIENFRMDLLFEKLQVDERQPEHVLRVQELDLKRFQLSSLHRLQPFSRLAFLIASHNHLTTLEEDVFFNLPCLTYLDLQHNEIEDKGAKLLAVFSRMPALKALFIRKSTKDKSKTAKPRQYLKRVCSVVRQIEILDGLPNPFQVSGPGGSGIMGQVALPPTTAMMHHQHHHYHQQGHPLALLPPHLHAQAMGYPMVAPDGYTHPGYLPHMQPVPGSSVDGNGYVLGPDGAPVAVAPWMINAGGSSSDLGTTFSKVISPPRSESELEPSAPPAPSEDGLDEEEDDEDEDDDEEEAVSSESEESDDDEVESEDEPEDAAATALPAELAGLKGVSTATLRPKKAKAAEALTDELVPQPAAAATTAAAAATATGEESEKDPWADLWSGRKTIRSAGSSMMTSTGSTPTLKRPEPLVDLSSDDSDEPEMEEEQEEEWETGKAKSVRGDDADDNGIGEEDADLTDDDEENEDETSKEKEENARDSASGGDAAEAATESENESDSESDREEEAEVALESEPSEVEVEEGSRLWEPEREVLRPQGDDELEAAELKSFKESMRQQASGSAVVAPRAAAMKRPAEPGSGKARKKPDGGNSSSSTDSDSAEEEEGGKDDEYWESDEDDASEDNLLGSGSRLRKQSLWSSTPQMSATLRLLASGVSTEVLADYG